MKKEQFELSVPAVALAMVLAVVPAVALAVALAVVPAMALAVAQVARRVVVQAQK